jgi:hypothetical protein
MQRLIDSERVGITDQHWVKDVCTEIATSFMGLLPLQKKAKRERIPQLITLTAQATHYGA